MEPHHQTVLSYIGNSLMWLSYSFAEIHSDWANLSRNSQSTWDILELGIKESTKSFPQHVQLCVYSIFISLMWLSYSFAEIHSDWANLSRNSQSTWGILELGIKESTKSFPQHVQLCVYSIFISLMWLSYSFAEIHSDWANLSRNSQSTWGILELGIKESTKSFPQHVQLCVYSIFISLMWLSYSFAEIHSDWANLSRNSQSTWGILELGIKESTKSFPQHFQLCVYSIFISSKIGPGGDGFIRSG